MEYLKKIAPDAIAVVLFLLISLAYFFTPVTQGLVLTGHDNTAGTGANSELGAYAERTGETTRWTNALFSGMPTYQMSPEYGSRQLLSTLSHVYELELSGAMMFVFILLLGFYILLRAFDFRVWMAALGAIVWAFSSYFFIIIAAGHLWKVLTLAFIPPTIAGLVLCYRGKLLWGGILTAFFTALQVLSNHIQMSYYFLLVMGLMVLGYLVQAIRTNRIPQFLKSTGVVVVAGLIGVTANLSNLYHTYEYSKETMRGKSELTNPAEQSKASGSGLSRDYITQWSYGIGESWTLLVPNTKGGASVPLALNERAMQKADPQYVPIYNQIGQYWGEQPGTSGPVYVGAFILFLFVLGLFIVKGALKWSLLAATVLSLFMAWGHNFMAFTDFCIDYVPMYNKFRAVTSALVIAEFTIPLLGLLALARLVEEPDLVRTKARYFYISFGLTGGIALLFAIVPDLFFSEYVSSNERTMFSQGLPAEMMAPFIHNLSEMRQAIFTADAWRSFFIVLIGAAALWLYGHKKLNLIPMGLILIVLCLVDLWQVDKRYLNDSCFVEPWQNERAFQKTATDEAILQDPSPNYRVLNLASNTFNENNTSYWHKSIGGYHAAKLRRYQDLIEQCLSDEMLRLGQAIPATGGDLSRINGDSLCPVLNMLNAKYIIAPAQQNGTVPVGNPHALGNAWFVSRLHYADGANAEMAALKKLHPAYEAVADKRFEKELGAAENLPAADTTARAVLTKYEPNELTYDVRSEKGGLVVFSEIYYPGWTATLDGEPLAIGRADYVLRAVRVPAGKHEVTFSFRPTTVRTTEILAYSALALLFLAFAAALFIGLRRKQP